MNILVIAEHDNIELARSTLSTLAAAQRIIDFDTASSLDILVAGYSADNFDAIKQTLQNLRIANKVVMINHEIYKHDLAEIHSDLIVNLARDYDYVLLPATTFGKNIAPRVAALLEINLLSDVTDIVDLNHFKRPIYAGNAIATFKLTDEIKLLTIRTTSFDLTNRSDTDTACINLEANELNCKANHLSKFIEYKHIVSERPELSSASIVVSGGRALNSKENFELIENLADVLKAGVGASRAAVDAGYISNDHQVGQTGKVVAPRLYIAVGISGAIQHLAGIQDSKVIVAINKDPDAPIFKVADYGLVGDLFTILPELTEKLAKL